MPVILANKRLYSKGYVIGPDHLKTRETQIGLKVRGVCINDFSGPVRTTLPVYIKHVKYWTPNLNAQYNVLVALSHRVARKMPVGAPSLLRSLRRNVKTHILPTITRLSSSEPIDFEEWLTHTSYTETEKVELRQAYEVLALKTDKEVMKIAAFLKDENYDEKKAPRGIYSRSIFAKVLFGPWIWKIEQEVYKLGPFIKGIPDKDKVSYIENQMTTGSNLYFETDYSSFESSFTPQLMENCEFMLYDYMLAHIPAAARALKLLKMTSGVNRISFRKLRAQLVACRMSGEMTTSLSNGFANLCFMDFAARRAGISYSGVVEGDDGLFQCSHKFDESIFTALGLDIKFKWVSSIGEASFCGLAFDEVTKQKMKDPFKALLNMGWSSSQYVNANERTLETLLYSKALSCLHSLPNCPIVAPFARQIIERYAHRHNQAIKQSAKSRDRRFRGRFKEISTLELPTTNILPATRDQFMIRYGISPSRQIQLESSLEFCCNDFWRDCSGEFAAAWQEQVTTDTFKDHYESSIKTTWTTVVRLPTGYGVA